MPEQGFSTRSLHAGEDADLNMVSRPKTMPIYETSVFVYDNLAQADDFSSGNPDNFMYTRLGNPNQRALEIWAAEMESGADAVCCASGMAALMAVIASECGAGDKVAAAQEIYGGTQSLLSKELERFGIEVYFLNSHHTEAISAELRPATKILLVETASNPLVKLANIPLLAKAAHSVGTKLVVDNTFLSPVLFQPLKHGADAVIHSTTKYINGHSDATGGLVIADADWVSRARRFVHNGGASLSPFEAWLTMRGAKTLALRMERHVANAQKIAEWLQTRPGVVRVHFPGLESHAQHLLARTLFHKGTGGILSFDLRGGLAAADELVQTLKMIKFAPSLAGVSTTISHPAKTSHRSYSSESLAKLGITAGTIRLSVGIEDLLDIIADLSRAI